MSYSLSALVIGSWLRKSPSCCTIGVNPRYSLSANCLMLDSSTLAMLPMSLESAARTARRIPTPSAAPAPEGAVSHCTRWSTRCGSPFTIKSTAEATAETIAGLSGDVQLPRRCSWSVERIWRTSNKTLRCSFCCRPSISMANFFWSVDSSSSSLDKTVLVIFAIMLLASLPRPGNSALTKVPEVRAPFE